MQAQERGFGRHQPAHTWASDRRRASRPGRVMSSVEEFAATARVPKGRWKGLQLRHWHAIERAKGDTPGRWRTGGTCGWVFQAQVRGRQRFIHRKQGNSGEGQWRPSPPQFPSQRLPLAMSFFILRVFYLHNEDSILRLFPEG